MASPESVLKSVLRYVPEIDPVQALEAVWIAALSAGDGVEETASDVQPEEPVADGAPTSDSDTEWSLPDFSSDASRSDRKKRAADPTANDVSVHGASDDRGDGGEPVSEVEPHSVTPPNLGLTVRKSALRRADEPAESLSLVRNIRALRRRRTTGSTHELDPERTIEEIERSGVFQLATRRASERWFDTVVLAVDSWPSTAIWSSAIESLTKALVQAAAFRNVRTYDLSVDGPSPVMAPAADRSGTPDLPSVPDDRRLLIIFSDYTGDGWRSATTWSWVTEQTERSSLLLLSPLPSSSWPQTALSFPRAHVSTSASSLVEGGGARQASSSDGATFVPVATLSASSLRRWSSSLMGVGRGGMDGLLVPVDTSADLMSLPEEIEGFEPVSVEQRAASFLAMASAPARKLATLLSPWRVVDFDFIRLLRKELVPEAEVPDLAELVLSGVFEVRRQTPKLAQLWFHEPARVRLRSQLRRSDAWDLLEALTRLADAPARGDEMDLLVSDEYGELSLQSFRQKLDLRQASTEVAAVVGRTDFGAWGRTEEPGKRPRVLPGADTLLRELDVQRAARLFEVERLESASGVGRNSLIAFADVVEGVRAVLRRPGSEAPGIRMTFDLTLLQTLRDTVPGPWALNLLAASFAAGKVTPPTAGAARVIGNGVPDLREWLGEPVPYSMTLNQAKRARERLLLDHKSVMITGPTGSGKSTQARFWVQQCLNREDRLGLIVLDLIDPHDGPASVVEALLLQPDNPWYLLVIDDVHLNQGNGLAIFALVDRLRSEAGLRMAVLATGRVDHMQDLLRPYDVLLVPSKPQAVFDRRLAEYSDLTDEQRLSIEALCGKGTDLNLLDYVCTYMDEHDEVVPGDVGLAQYIGRRLRLEELTAQSHRDALYHFACMGMYEVDVPAVYASGVFHNAIEPLSRLRLIERADTSFRVPSRSIGAHVARYAMLYWDNPSHRLRHPAEVAAVYLEAVSDQYLEAVLDRARDIVVGDGVRGTALRRVFRAWQRRQELALSLAKYVSRDPEWGQNAASAAFAAIAMSHLGLAEKWALSADWVRERWDYGEDGDLPRCTGSEPTAEVQDFVKMREHMRRVDVDGADDLDLELAHRTWMTAMLLWMEAEAPNQGRSVERTNQLVDAAVSAQEAFGFFYPSRVPWVTARVLISLCDAGEADSAAAEAAVRWLAEQARPGWTSSTGSWNTDAMTTATCLIALRRQSHAVSKEVIRAGYANLDALLAQSRLLSGSLSEIDKALCAEAYLLSPDQSQREKGYELLESVQEWLHTEDAWRAPWQGRTELFNSPTVDSEEDSAKLAFVVCQVARCVWLMVRADLPLVFEDMAVQFGIPRRSTASAENFSTVDQMPGPLAENSGRDQDSGFLALALADSALVHQTIVARARAGIPRIEREIARNIESREEALRGRRRPQPRIEESLSEWVAHARRLEDLKSRLESDPVEMTLIEELDALGAEALQRRWHPLLP